MPATTPVQSARECRALSERADRAQEAMDRNAEIEALQALAAHPCTVHQMDLPGVWADLATALWAAKRWDEAISARESAIAAGYRSVPHPRAEIAEILLDAGRRPEAEAIYAELRAETPDDVWLYNSAGWAYSRAGDHQEALRWLDEGIELDLRAGDPDDLIDQLMDYRRQSQEALGLPPDDEIAARVATFERPPRALNRVSAYFGGTPPEPAICAHCGWHPGPEAPVEKVGRNQACPCGSGRKYKHCHGR